MAKKLYMRKKYSLPSNNIPLNTNFQDNINNDYVERWLQEEFQLYFDFLRVHYKIIEFRQNKRLELIKKNPYMKSSDISKKIDKMKKKDLERELSLICERKVNTFLLQ